MNDNDNTKKGTTKETKTQKIDTLQTNRITKQKNDKYGEKK